MDKLINIISEINEIGSCPKDVEFHNGDFRIYLDTIDNIDIHEINRRLIDIGITDLTIDDIDYDGDQGSTVHGKWTI